MLSQCTAEVAHFSLQWWTEPSALKHRSNKQGEQNLLVNLKVEHNKKTLPGVFY